MKCGNRYEKMQFRVVSHSTDVSDSKYVKVSCNAVCCVSIVCWHSNKMN